MQDMLVGHVVGSGRETKVQGTVKVRIEYKDQGARAGKSRAQ